MSEISDYIKEAYTSIRIDEERRPIASDTVDAAMDVLKSYRINDTVGLFYYLAAINLLNAAIKMKQYKKRLRYSFIKGKARVVTEYVIAKNRFDGVFYHYNKPENCLYVKVLDVVFSFHYVDETPFILGPASQTAPVEWSGIRLQILAEEIFLKAKEMESNK